MNSCPRLCLPDVDLYIYIYYTRFLLSGLGPETYVALLLVNIHFLKICILTGIFFFLNCMSRLEDLNNWACQTESCANLLELARFLCYTIGIGGARQIDPLVILYELNWLLRLHNPPLAEFVNAGY